MNHLFPNFASLLQRCPDAAASLSGSPDYPCLRGDVRFYQTSCGVLVAARVQGLPSMTVYSPGFFGFHIHDGEECTGNQTDAFADAGSHYNPEDVPHPFHAGDMSPLMGANGMAFAVFLTARFCLQDIIGKTVILHSMPDDFVSQPAGNAGEKIACGVISCCRR